MQNIWNKLEPKNFIKYVWMFSRRKIDYSVFNLVAIIMSVYITAEIAIHIEICSFKNNFSDPRMMLHSPTCIFTVSCIVGILPHAIMGCTGLFLLMALQKNRRWVKKNTFLVAMAVLFFRKCFFLHHTWTHFCAIHHIM